MLYNALEIAKSENSVDFTVLITACLLHDIGRREQFENPSLCHAKVGGEKAYSFLMENNFGEEFSQKVRHCIQTHRFRKCLLPESMPEPIYNVLSNGEISDGTQDISPSFFREYKFKLEKLYDKFYTTRGAQLAQEQRGIAEAFYKSLYQEVNIGYTSGREKLLECMWRNK